MNAAATPTPAPATTAPATTPAAPAISALHRTPDAVLERFAAEVSDSGPVAVEGSRTRWSLGGEPSPEVRLVQAPIGIVDYQPEEMTVRVRAGTSVADLNAALRERGQRCALPDRGGTVGGAVVVGENHLELLGRGALRASVLEVRYVSADGQLVIGGGPTVKNVTGFDLPRLITGSLGTLGLLGEVILRTNPIPASHMWVVADGIDPFVARDRLPRCGALLWNGSSVWALLEGHPTEVDEQLQRLRAIGPVNTVEGPPELPEHRWSLEPAALRTLGGGSGASDTGRFVASVGTGTVFAEHPQPAGVVDPGVRAVSARVKHEFDPTGRLNPGRNPLHR